MNTINGDDEDIDYGCNVLVTEEDGEITTETITAEEIKRRAQEIGVKAEAETQRIAKAAREINAAALRHMSEHEGRRVDDQDEENDTPDDDDWIIGKIKQMTVGRSSGTEENASDKPLARIPGAAEDARVLRYLADALPDVDVAARLGLIAEKLEARA